MITGGNVPVAPSHIDKVRNGTRCRSQIVQSIRALCATSESRHHHQHTTTDATTAITTMIAAAAVAAILLQLLLLLLLLQITALTITLTIVSICTPLSRWYVHRYYCLGYITCEKLVCKGKKFSGFLSDITVSMILI